MGAFTTRQVIVLPFPYSDLSTRKLRPALILADTGRGDWVLCQITSNPYADSSAVELTQEAFASGSLQRVSYARPNKLFTAHESLFSGIVGNLTAVAHLAVVENLVSIIRMG